jgi:hypothetical protein
VPSNPPTIHLNLKKIEEKSIKILVLEFEKENFNSGKEI